jgi:MFS family permease
MVAGMNGSVDVSAAGSRSGLRAIPRGIWILGLVSLFMDLSSEMIHSLLPLFLVSALGTTTVAVGLIEGIAEATAAVTKIFSGSLSDWLGQRKLLAVAGYGLAALSKPLFALAQTAGLVVAARFIDRVGKGIRGAPRDALVGEIAPQHLRGACYGLRQSLDTVGAFAGPLGAVALMALTANDFRAVFWVAVVPAVAATVLLLFGIEEPKTAPHAASARAPIKITDLLLLDRRYWAVVAIGTVLSLARFSEAFLVLRAADLGLSIALAPLVLVAMNLVYALSAYPAGLLSDRLGRSGMLAAGFVVLIAADAVLAAAGGLAAVFVGVLLWGLHMGLTQGLFAALVADSAPPDRRGTAFGIFNLATGLALLAASVAAGWLWAEFGASAAFLCGGALTVLALAAAMGRGGLSR